MMVPFIKPIWNTAEPNSKRGFNQFVKANTPAFGTNGVVNNPVLLRFSAGSLPLPAGLNAVLPTGQLNKIAVSLGKSDGWFFN
jgi:hypothetical protein